MPHIKQANRDYIILNAQATAVHLNWFSGESWMMDDKETAGRAIEGEDVVVVSIHLIRRRLGAAQF